MTEEQFNEIKERLAKWREERKLTYENQREGFLGNVFEEISEYFRAKNDLERTAALCDIVVFCFNAFDMNYDYYREYSNNIENPRIDSIIDSISFFIYKKIKNASFPNNPIPSAISRCFKLGNSLGFDFYKCMLEAIKEISSRTGKYDESIGKFIKDKGAYTKKEAKKIYPKCNIEDIGDGFMIFDYKGHTKDYLIKWYKANYESCKL